MKLYTLPLLMALSIGCNKLPFGPNHHNNENNQSAGLPDDYYINGVVTSDYDVVHFPTEDRAISVQVWRAGEMTYSAIKGPEAGVDFREYTLFKIPTTGLAFGKRIDYFPGGGYVLGNRPVAPKGTAYRIHSVATKVDHGI